MNAQEKDRALAQRIADQYTCNSYPNIDHARTLRRAQMTLHRWAEEECNGTIQRTWDTVTEDQTGRPHRWTTGDHRSGPRDLGPIPDRERGALARVEKVCKATGLHYYYQRDPRGCALFVSAQPMTDTNYSQKGIPCL